MHELFRTRSYTVGNLGNAVLATPSATSETTAHGVHHTTQADTHLRADPAAVTAAGTVAASRPSHDISR